jgi:hypothetical protein
MTDLKDDISYMRRLAEQGRSGPILGGTFLAAAGLVFGATCFVQWGVETNRLPIAPAQTAYLRTGAMVFFAIIWLTLFFRLQTRNRSPSTVPNIAFGVAWIVSAVGIVVTVLTVSIEAHVTNIPAAQQLNAAMPFIFYGVAWSVPAAVARKAWMLAPAAVSFASAPILAALSDSPTELIAMGVALLLSLSLPGFKMMAEETRA